MGPHPNRLLNAAMVPAVPTCTTVDQCQIPTGKENIPFGLKNRHAGGCSIAACKPAVNHGLKSYSPWIAFQGAVNATHINT